jgi:hypothetical protein
MLIARGFKSSADDGQSAGDRRGVSAHLTVEPEPGRGVAWRGVAWRGVVQITEGRLPGAKPDSGALLATIRFLSSSGFAPGRRPNSFSASRQKKLPRWRPLSQARRASDRGGRPSTLPSSFSSAAGRKVRTIVEKNDFAMQAIMSCDAVSPRS